MASKLHPWQIQSAITNRLSVMTEMEQKLARLREHEKTLTEDLLKAAPEDLCEFIKEEGLIENFFRYGRCSIKVRYDSYGFHGFETIKGAMKKLESAWKDNVTIRMARPEGDRVEIYFGATQL